MIQNNNNEAEKVHFALLRRKDENERYIDRARNWYFFGFSTYKKGEI